MGCVQLSALFMILLMHVPPGPTVCGDFVGLKVVHLGTMKRRGKKKLRRQ